MKTTDTGITNVELGNSYKCDSGIAYMMTGDNNSTVYLTLKDLQLQVFQFNSPGEFGEGLYCFIKCLLCFQFFALCSHRML